MLPKQVREAGERADAAHNALTGNTAQSAPEKSAPNGEQKPVDQQAATPPAAPQEPAAATPPVAPAPDGWEHKYKVLSNKYSAEVPRMAQEIRELKDKIREQSESKATAVVAEPPSSLTPEKVVEQYGDDFAAAVGALASKISEQSTAKLREEFAPKMEAATSTANISARQMFLKALSDAVPDWQVIDQEEGFTAFLDDVDQLTGRPRRRFFEEADQSNDALRIVKFFTTYREGSSAKQSQSNEVAKNAVEYSLSPSSSRANEVPAGKRVWTQADIRKFYSDARRGLFTPQDYQRIESDIDAALSDGRFLAE